MNNAIITDRKDVGVVNVYARFDRHIDHYRSFAFVKCSNPSLKAYNPILTRKQMNYMLIRSTIYKLPARPIHI